MTKRMMLAALLALAAVPALAADTSSDRSAAVASASGKQIAAPAKGETVARACTCSHG